MILSFAAALGIGLLIGADRERRKGEWGALSPAGVRTFALASLTGALCTITGGELLLAFTIGGVFVLTAFSYWRGHEDDPGLTTGVALVVAVLLQRKPRTELERLLADGNTAQKIANRARYHLVGQSQPILAAHRRAQEALAIVEAGCK